MAHSEHDVHGEERRKEKADFTKSIDIAEKAIISRGKELKELVDQCTWCLLEELTEIKYDGLKDMERENEEFESRILEHDRFKTFRTDFKSSFSTYESGLHEDFTQAQQPSRSSSIHDRILSIQISFEISKLENLLKGNNIVGKIKREDKRVAVETKDVEVEFHEGEDKRVTVETKDVEVEFHEEDNEEKDEQEIVDDEATTGEIAYVPEQEIVDDEATTVEIAYVPDASEKNETSENADENEKAVYIRDNEEIFRGLVETKIGEDETMAKRKSKKTQMSTKKRPDCRHTNFLEDINQLPLLCATYTDRDQNNPDPRLRKCKSISLMKTLDHSKVWGVTKLEDSIYLLSWMPNSIRVYKDEDPFPLHEEIHLEEIQNPEDIAANRKTKCLYVSDMHDRCIWEISLSPGDHKVTKWLSNVDKPFTLSMTTDDHLLLLRDTGTQTQLEIYGTEAALIRNLRLPSAIQRPLHAIQKPNGQFIILHRLMDLWIHKESEWLTPPQQGINPSKKEKKKEKKRLMDRETDGQWVISNLTNDGQLIGHFIPETKSIGCLDWPYHMALNSEDDRLFVADYWNHRVIRISDSFSCMGETILTAKTVNRPLRLHYDEKKKQLIVANSRRVDIYVEH